MKIFFCIIFFFFSFWFQGHSQTPSQLKLNHLTLEDGLSQNSGQAILQDSHGYMWFGTLNGLNKYNGYDFKVFKHDPSDSTSISGSHISYLYEDSRGNLWIGTTGAGLNLYDRNNDSFIHFKVDHVDHHLSISDNSVSSIIEGPDGKFWIGTMSGLNIFDRDTKEFIHFFAVEDQPESLSGSDITSLYLDKKGTLWIGTTIGLNYWDEITGKFGHFKADSSDPYSISHNSISVIYEDEADNLWIGTSGGGLNLFERDKERFFAYKHDDEDPHSISGNTILSILEDSRGVLWIGTENEGLNIFNQDNKTFYHHKSNVSNPASLNHNSIFTLYENEDQIFYIGTSPGGISYMDRKDPKFEHYSHDPFDPNPLSNNYITSFLQVSEGSLLVGTDGGGLNVLDRETLAFSTYKHSPDNPATLSSNVILALHEDSEGRIWFGYYNGGLTSYNTIDGTIKHYRHTPDDPGGLRNDHVFVIHEGRDGELWFGTNGGGIHQLNPETDTFDLIATETDGSSVTRALYEDTSGNLWVGSYGGGLIQIDSNDGTVINQYFDGMNGLTSNVVLVIYEDQEQNLWIGTNDGGLFLFDRDHETFKSYSIYEGLPSPSVRGILEDDSGNLWLSTGSGLSMFNPDSETFINYNVEHGIQSSEFNPLAYYKDKEGFMYFGGINGFNRFHPDRVAIEEKVPPVVLTDFKIFNQSIDIGEDSYLTKHISQTEKIEIPYSASVLTLDYVALNFNKTKGDEFAYMLEGFDSDWNYVGDRRSATYTNLNPGEYTFRVKAANRYGFWSESDKTLALTITPPFWQTTWFYFLLVLSAIGLIGGGIRWRLESITNQNKILEKEVDRQTADLFDKNNELEKTLVELKQARSELVEKAHKAGMADLATNVLHNVGNILNSVNISVALIDETLKRSKFKGFKQASKLLRENSDDLKDFIMNDPRGEKVLNYIIKLEDPLDKEFDKLTGQTKRLNKNMKLMIDVVTAQQSYSTVSRVLEDLSIVKLIEDTLILQSATIERHGLDLVTNYQPVDDIQAEKSKTVHILTNLFKNAKESMEDLEPGNKKLMLNVFQDDRFVYLSIIDNGCGIPEENREKIFNHGFTTKSYGHGFGLHSCANYMKEMKGKIKIESEGAGKGTNVTLCFTRKNQNNKIKKLSERNYKLSELAN